MGNVSHEQANLMLKIYELRREPRLRQARAWFVSSFSAGSLEEMMQKFPPFSEEGTNVRMISSYWEMCAGLSNRGLIDDDLFFENNPEVWVVWEKLKAIVPGLRAMFGNPTAFEHLEKCAKRLDAWREKKAPGCNDKMRQMFAQMAQMRAQAAK